jgi:hypothetical protein
MFVWIIRLIFLITIIGVFLFNSNKTTNLPKNTLSSSIERLKKEAELRRKLQAEKNKIKNITQSNLPQEEKEQQIQEIIQENKIKNGLNLKDLQEDEDEVFSEEQIERELGFMEKFGKEIQVGGIALEIYSVMGDISEFTESISILRSTLTSGRKTVSVTDNVAKSIKNNAGKAVQKISQKLSNKVSSGISKVFSKNISKVMSGILKNSTKVASKALTAAKKLAGPALGVVFIGAGAAMCFTGVENDDSLDEKRKDLARAACGIELAMDIITFAAPLIAAAIGGAIAAAVGVAFGAVAIILAVVMIISAILDAEDPCAYGRPLLDDKQIADIRTSILASVYEEIVKTIKEQVPPTVKQAYRDEITRIYEEAGFELNDETLTKINETYDSQEEEINKLIDENIVIALNDFKYPAPYEFQGSDFKTKLNDEDLNKFLKYYQEYFEICDLHTPNWTEEEMKQFSINSENQSKLRALRFDKMNKTLALIPNLEAMNKQIMEETSMLANKNLQLVQNIIKTSNVAIENQKKIKAMINMSQKEKEQTLAFIKDSSVQVITNSIENLTLVADNIPPDMYKDLLVELGVDENFVDDVKKIKEQNLEWRRKMTEMIKKNKDKVFSMINKIESKSSFSPENLYIIGVILVFYFLFELYNFLTPSQEFYPEYPFY